MSISSSAHRRPFVFAGLLEAGVMVVFLVLFAALRNAFPAISPSDTDLILNAIAYTLLAVATALLLSRLRWWQPAGFRRPLRWPYLLLFWLPALPVALSLLVGIKPAAIEPWRIAVFLVVSLLVGFVEEGVYRGLMVRALRPKGMWIAAWVSSLLFGLAHSVNFVLGYNPQAVLLQLVYATAIYGFASAALVIYTRTIWPIVIIHALADFLAWLQGGTTVATTGVTMADVLSTPVWSAVAIGYGILMLALARRAERRQAAVS